MNQKTKLVPLLAAALLSFVAGSVVTVVFAAKSVKLYVSKPGEYVIDPVGGNYIVAMSRGTDLSFLKCRYFENADDYDARVTWDVLDGRVSVEPECFSTFSRE